MKIQNFKLAEGNAIPTAAREREIYLIALPALKAGASTLRLFTAFQPARATLSENR